MWGGVCFQSQPLLPTQGSGAHALSNFWGLLAKKWAVYAILQHYVYPICE